MQNKKMKTLKNWRIYKPVKFSKKQINRIVEAFQSANSYEYLDQGDKYNYLQGFLASLLSLTQEGYTRNDLVKKFGLKEEN